MGDLAILFGPEEGLEKPEKGQKSGFFDPFLDLPRGGVHPHPPHKDF